MLEMSDIEVTKVLESDATEWQKKLFNLYNPYPLKISFQNQLIQNYGIGARDRFDQLVKEGKGMVPKRALERVSDDSAPQSPFSAPQSPLYHR